MRKRGRFVETSARANRSSLFSRRSEIALFMRSPRGWLQSWCSPSSPLQDLYLIALMLLYTHPHARVGSGWTCANTGRCIIQRRVTRETGANERQGRYMRGKNVATLFCHLADASSLWSVSASTGGSTSVVENERRGPGAPGSSPLGRSCVNPLREAHTKLVSLSFSLSLLSPCSSFPSKGCRDRPYKPLAACSASPIRVSSESTLICHCFYKLVEDIYHI